MGIATTKIKVTVGQKAKFLFLVRYIVMVLMYKYTQGVPKNGFQLPKYKGEMTTLYKTLTIK